MQKYISLLFYMQYTRSNHPIYGCILILERKIQSVGNKLKSTKRGTCTQTGFLLLNSLIGEPVMEIESHDRKGVHK
jgi:hypothetical protein